MARKSSERLVSPKVKSLETSTSSPANAATASARRVLNDCDAGVKRVPMGAMIVGEREGREEKGGRWRLTARTK